MQRECTAVALVLWIGVAASHAAAPASKPATQPAKPPEVMTDAVDPFNAAKERARFFTAAGPDNELDRDEFAACREKPDAFVRKFDTFDGMLAFDKDASKTIDWFEAKAYREDVRKRVLAAFDADKNGRLAGAERDKANRALAAGRVPAAKAAASGLGGLLGGADPEAVKKFDADGDGRLSRDERRAMWRDRIERRRLEALAKYDTDDDGKLNEQERKTLRDEIRTKWTLRAFDKNGDGQLDDAETAEMEKGLARLREGRAKWDAMRAEMVKKHDRDGDGKLTGEERRAAWQDMRNQWMTKAFDADKDGRLDETETAAMEKAQAESRTTYDRWRSDWVRKYDADGDGELSEAERQAGRDDLAKEIRDLRDAWMAKWDADGDGELSDTERQTMRESVRRRAADLRKEIDADGDGQVSGQEMQAFWQKLRQTYDADQDGVLNADEARQMIRDQMSKLFPGAPAP